jgi:ketosteroid isomerase-like protein
MTKPIAAESPEQAEALFYAAFEDGDLETMANIWARSGDVVCVHPNGPQLLGYGPVMQSWRNILDDTTGFRIDFKVVRHFDDGDTSVRFVNETLINEEDEAIPVTILATNAYQRTESGWRIVLHHASPMPRAAAAPGEETPAPSDTSITLH